MPKPFWFYVVIAVILMVGGIALLGIPGALYAFAAEPVVMLLRGLPEPILMGDRAWPAAILMTLVVPPIIPLARLAQTRFWPELNGWAQLGVLIAALYLFSVVTLFTMSF